MGIVLSSRPLPSIDEIREQLMRDAHGLAVDARNLAWRRGLLLWLTTVLAAVAVLLAIDFYLQREEFGLRLLSLAALLLVMIYAARRFLVPAWSFAPTPLHLASWIESVRPDLKGRLSTALEIAQTPAHEDRFGSLRFREAVLQAWAAEPHKPDWSSYLDSRRLWQALALFALPCLLLGSGLALWPSQTKQAALRLLVPWQPRTWPRQDQLEIQNLPSVVAVGSELQLEIVDRHPPLPNQVDLLVRYDDSAATGPQTLATKQIEGLAIANLASLERALEVRAVGGDDQQMPWQRIEVISPPSLSEFRFVIQPPAYSGRESAELVGNRIQVLAGSRVAFQGRLDAPVADVTVESLDANAANPEMRNWKVELDSDRQTLSIGGGRGVELTRSLSWRFMLTTTDGLRIEQPQPWNIEVIADEPPRVSLNGPSMDRMTSQAGIELRGSATDDLGLQDISAHASLGSQADESSISRDLWHSQASTTREQQIQQVWNLAQDLAAQATPPANLTSQADSSQLPVGQVVYVWLQARDSLGQIGRSQVLRLEVQSPQEILEAVLDQQADLLRGMRELVDSQRKNLATIAASWPAFE